MSKYNKRTEKQRKIVPVVADDAVSVAGPSFKISWMMALGGCILYLNTLGHGFVLDDALVTTLNKYVQAGFGGLADIFSHSYRAGASVATDSEYMYRPLSVAAFAVEWAIAPNTPGIHHFFNVLWYGLTILVLFRLLSRIFKEAAPVLIGGMVLLFIVHPIHTEVVANIKSRDELMSMALGMMSLNGLIGYQERGRIERLLFAMLLFFLSLLAKEGAVTLLVVAPLILYYTTPGNKNWRSAGLGLWLLLPFAAWLVLRMAVMTNGLAYTPDFNDNPLVGAGFSDRMATGFVLLGSYLQLLIMPLVQSWDYSYNQIPVVSWMHPAPWAWALVHILGAVMALRWLSTKNIGGLILLAYLVSILLYSNQFILIGTMMGTRLVYAASVWFCVGLALVAHRATGRRVTESPAIAWKLFMVSLALVYGVMTFIRSATWKDAHTLFTADAEHAPRSFRTQRAAAEQYLVWYSEHRTSRDTGVWLDKAAVLYRRSLSIQPTENAWIGLGNIAYFRRLYPEAVRSFEQALELKPNNALAREQLGHCYRDWGKWEGQVKNNLPKAAELLQKSVDYHPGDADAWQALGTARGLLLQHDLAVGAFEAALKLNPGNPEILRNLAIAYQGLGDQEKFLSTLRLLKQGG